MRYILFIIIAFVQLGYAAEDPATEIAIKMEKAILRCRTDAIRDAKRELAKAMRAGDPVVAADLSTIIRVQQEICGIDPETDRVFKPSPAPSWDAPFTDEMFAGHKFENFMGRTYTLLADHSFMGGQNISTTNLGALPKHWSYDDADKSITFKYGESVSSSQKLFLQKDGTWLDEQRAYKNIVFSELR